MKKATVIGGRYRLDARLAEGGMGEVWRAHDQLLGRAVAVKVLRTALTSDPVVAERFRREARAAASLSHPNMANVFDYIEEEARPGIVMELLDGRTLADVIAREAPMQLERAAVIIDQVLAALVAAHAGGVVHRDVKPANVMIDDTDHVKVADFGIARALGESTLTETGTVLGSVHYVAPEQLHGSSPQPASDLYAVGVMLYEMLTARRPFEAETPVAVAMSRLQNDPESPRTHRPDIPHAVEAVVMRSLAREPSGRYESGTAMRSALADAVRRAQEEITTLPMPAVDASPTAGIPAVAGPEHTTRLPAQETVPTTALRTVTTPRPAKPKRERKPVRVFRPALLGVSLGLLTLGLIAAFLLRPPGKVTVPLFEGRQLAGARHAADQAGLKLAVVDHETSATAAKGVILDQLTEKGTIVTQGSTIRVVVSDGPPPCCTVPDLKGLTRNEAEERLRRAGLDLGTVSVKVSGEEPGTVIEQAPEGGDSLSPGGKVSIVLAVRPDEDENKGPGKRRD